MIAILEIIMTVFAWRKGWKARALIPMGVTFGLGFLLGLVIVATGASMDAIIVPALLGDLACLGVLGRMVAKAPRDAATAAPAAEAKPAAAHHPAHAHAAA